MEILPVPSVISQLLNPKVVFDDPQIICRWSWTGWKSTRLLCFGLVGHQNTIDSCMIISIFWTGHHTKLVCKEKCFKYVILIIKDEF